MEDAIFRTGIIQNYSTAYPVQIDPDLCLIGYTDQQGVVVGFLPQASQLLLTRKPDKQMAQNRGNLQYHAYQQVHQEGGVTKANPILCGRSLSERWPYAYKRTDHLSGVLEPSMTTVNPLGSWGKEYNDCNQNRLLLKAYVEVKFTDWLKAKTIISND